MQHLEMVFVKSCMAAVSISSESDGKSGGCLNFCIGSLIIDWYLRCSSPSALSAIGEMELKNILQPALSGIAKSLERGMCQFRKPISLKYCLTGS